MSRQSEFTRVGCVALAVSVCLLSACATATPRRGASMIQEAHLVQVESGEHTDLGGPLRVATYNIQDLTDGKNDGHLRTPSVTQRHLETAAGVVNEIKADILFIEEIENETILKRLNALVRPPYPIAYISQFDGGRYKTKRNIAVLSRLDFMKVCELDFGPVKSEVHLSRGALMCAADLGGGHTLLAYGVHLKSNFGKKEGKDASNIAKRTEALKLIRGHAERVISANKARTWEVIVAGDMNVDPEAAGFETDTSLSPMADWVDLWLGTPLEQRVTIPARSGDPDLEYPPACFDRIIVSKDLQRSPWRVSRIEVLQRGVDTENVFTQVGQNEIHASDHYPVYIDIEP